MELIKGFFQFIGICLLVVLVFNLIILVHELGHFLAAKWRGLKVDRFQVWFGKPIWKKTVNGVQYGLGCIPAGGFVSLPQMSPMEMLEGKPADPSCPPAKPLDKIIVAFAGPLFSAMLAVVFACIVWLAGKPANIYATNVIGYVEPGGPADQAGLKLQDEILRVDGQKITTIVGPLDSVNWRVVSNSKDSMPFEVRRDGQIITLDVKPRVRQDEAPKDWVEKWFHRPPMPKIGITGKYDTLFVHSIMDNSPAQLAGVKVGDRLVSMNGIPVLSPVQLDDYSKQQKDKPVQLTVDRDGESLTFNLTPRVPDNKGTEAEEATTGIRDVHPEHPDTDPNAPLHGKSRYDHPTPVAQITDTFRIMYNTLTAVSTPGSGVSLKHLNGPVGIMHLYYRLFESPDNWRLVLWFSVILNINLAVMNMLPLPVLDGGHIMMAIIELVTRRPMNPRVLLFLYNACALLLISFIMFVTVFDGGDILRQNQTPKYVPSSFNAPTPVPVPIPASS